MAFSLNKIQLIGNLGKDAEHSATPSGTSVTRFSVATTNSYKDNSGSWKEETTWHNITAFNLSDFSKNTLRKGKKVYVEGRLTIDKYEAKDGTKRESAKIIAQQIIPLDSQGGGSGGYQRNTDAEGDSGFEASPEDLSSSIGTTEDDLPF